ncbi:hypothetical protein AAVH_25870 [Aphelenchoides avenae]|nr:hypothetical protein AAVH_25870 [Aphelenchus avenae]
MRVDDSRLESLRLRGCNEFHVRPWDGAEKFHVTEQGILRYCFTLSEDLHVPETRVLRLAWADVTPTFFGKLTSKSSRLTSDVKLCLAHLRFDVVDLDIGVTPSRGREYDRMRKKYLQTVRYDIAGHGNGIRLVIDFRSGHRVDHDWEVTVRHGQKGHKAFFGPKPNDQ